MPNLRSLALLLSTLIMSLFPTTKLHTPHTNSHLTPLDTIAASPPYPITATPTLPQQSLDTIAEFIYPNTSVVSSGTNTATLRSTDDPNTITNWYKNIFSQHDIHNVTISITNTNDVVYNTFLGYTNSKYIEISIYKEAGSNSSIITITLSDVPSPSQDQSKNVHIENNIFNSANFY